MTAEQIIDANRYMTLATADAQGAPWASPVWFAHREYREFLWVSDPEARHSANLAVRPELAIVIFDSGAAPPDGTGVYMTAKAEQVTDDIELYSEQGAAQGLRAWALEDVTPPARFRLYRATVIDRWILAENSVRKPA